jgi:8-oxo-dGTP pyrophosphatase MutT (NUDIX family)
MTKSERERLGMDFDELWKSVWGDLPIRSHKHDYDNSKEKYNIIKDNGQLAILLSETVTDFVEPEWGFPKGRRNNNETDYDCAIREFCEETGFTIDMIHPIHNVTPFEEIFVGSNYISYKHKYFLVYMEYNDTLNLDNYQRSEVSKMCWSRIGTCLTQMRDYNLEKKRIITNVDSCLKQLSIYQM